MLKCCDVSQYQLRVDWPAAVADGIKVAIIRAGYRGYRYASIAQDPYADANIRGALAAKVEHTGLYFLSQAITATEAAEEARWCVDLSKTYALPCDAGIWYDSEASHSPADGRADGLSSVQRTVCAQAFCETIAAAGYPTGIYASTNWLQTRLDMSKLASWPLWVAQYGPACGYKSDKVIGWQYTSVAAVPWVERSDHHVDLSEWYQSFEPSARALAAGTAQIGCFATGGDQIALQRAAAACGAVLTVSDNTITCKATPAQQIALVAASTPLGIDWHIVPLDSDAVRMEAFATGADKLPLEGRLDGLCIPWHLDGDNIVTDVAVTAGDQRALISVAPDGVEWRIYTEPIAPEPAPITPLTPEQQAVVTMISNAEAAAEGAAAAVRKRHKHKEAQNG